MTVEDNDINNLKLQLSLLVSRMDSEFGNRMTEGNMYRNLDEFKKQLLSSHETTRVLIEELKNDLKKTNEQFYEEMNGRNDKVGLKTRIDRIENWKSGFTWAIGIIYIAVVGSVIKWVKFIIN